MAPDIFKIIYQAHFTIAFHMMSLDDALIRIKFWQLFEKKKSAMSNDGFRNLIVIKEA